MKGNDLLMYYKNSMQIKGASEESVHESTLSIAVESLVYAPHAIWLLLVSSQTASDVCSSWSDPAHGAMERERKTTVASD